jgi:hypothetical protein
MQSIYRFLLKQHIADTNKTTVMVKNIENTQTAIDDLHRNANIKLTLDRLFIGL